MSNRLPVIAIIAAIILYFVYASIFIVNAREQAIVLRFGQIVKVERQPGIYFKLPFGFLEADNVQIIEKRILRLDLNDIRVQVSGGKFYEVDAFVAYSIDDPRRFRQAVSGSITLAEQRLRTRLDAALRRVYGLRGFEAALSEERASMMREVADQLRTAAASLGLKVNDVRIRRTDLTDEVSQQTYDRMKAERLAEAERLRARGREAAARIKARADREVIEIQAAASRESEILRGEGDAKRSSIFADAYTRDPQFFRFYRSMNAYSSALNPSGTTMLLSPDSEFFRYFGNSQGDGPSGLKQSNSQAGASGPRLQDAGNGSNAAAEAGQGQGSSTPADAAPAADNTSGPGPAPGDNASEPEETGTPEEADAPDETGSDSASEPAPDGQQPPPAAQETPQPARDNAQ